MFSMVKVGAAVPKLKVADCDYNVAEMIKLIDEALEKEIKVLVFPELCITGYTCGDLFYQSRLLAAAEQALNELLAHTANVDQLIVAGLPVACNNGLFNCAVALHKGKILAVIPKTYLPNHHEFYEARWFSSATKLSSERISLCGQMPPVGADIILTCNGMRDLSIGIEICEDLWGPIPPSSFQALSGANLILNLSASNEVVTKSEYRVNMVSNQSARIMAAYVYVSSGIYESTTDLVFSGHSMICENGSLHAQSQRFSKEAQLIYADIDVELLMNSRRSTGSFMGYSDTAVIQSYRKVNVPLDFESDQDAQNTFTLARQISASPFIPPENHMRDERCEEIFNIQLCGLAKRLLHTGVKKSILAVSGGLDSTLALLCTVKAYDFLAYSREDIIGITMPGFGTTGRTYNNALALMQSLGITTREISIKDACIQHFKDIGHSADTQDVTYENAQARERMQIAMDVANMENGLVVGTGDLSELALGFTTYNGDHMSMYSVNCGIPKTLVRVLIDWIAQSDQLDKQSSEILEDILDTPVSPELLPPNEAGEIQQKTEDLIGPYELHDFFIYHVIRSGFAPKKILFLCEQAFGNQYSKAEIKKWMRLFYTRFFAQQFKRSCVPDGPKVGTVDLSPRGGWRMPSDASYSLWLKELDEIK